MNNYDYCCQAWPECEHGLPAPQAKVTEHEAARWEREAACQNAPTHVREQAERRALVLRRLLLEKPAVVLYRCDVGQHEDGTWGFGVEAQTDQDGECEGHGFPTEASAQCAGDRVIDTLNSSWAVQRERLDQ